MSFVCRCLVLVAGLAMCGSVGAVQADPLEFSHSFRAGEKFVVRTDHSSTIEVTEKETLQVIANATNSLRRYTIESIDDDGAATVLMEIEAVVITASDSESTVQYDSASAEEPPEQFIPVANSVGKPHARFKISPKGEVISVTPLQETTKKADEASQSLEQPFVRLPDGPVEIGGTWSETFKVIISIPDRLPEAVRLKRSYQLESIEDGLAKVSWKTIVLTPIDDTRLEAELVQRQLGGTFVFDTTAGRLVSRTGSSDRNVVGFRGGASMLRSIIKRKESLEPQTAAAGSTTIR